VDQTILCLPQQSKIYYKSLLHMELNPALEIIVTCMLLKLYFGKCSDYKLSNSNTGM